jgi:sugar/nucleoside kinase (ribokinase family)
VEFELSIPDGRAFDVVAFGLNAVDHLCVVPRYPERDTKIRLNRFHRAGGGQAASAMVVCARYGLRAKYVGKVGGDEIGAFSLASIREEGVDVSDVAVVDGATNQLAMIIVDERDGERTILWHRPPEIATSPEEITPERVAVGRVLLLDGHDAPAAARAAEVAHDHGVPVILDAETVKEGTGELVQRTDVLIASSDFPAAYTGVGDAGEALRALLSVGPSFVAMTLGRRGAIAVTASGATIESRAFEVDAIDTTGAGDVFHGAFIFGLLSGWSVERTLDFSNAAAALNCTAMGARGGMTGLGEVLDLMRYGRRL